MNIQPTDQPRNKINPECRITLKANSLERHMLKAHHKVLQPDAEVVSAPALPALFKAPPSGQRTCPVWKEFIDPEIL